MDKDEDEDRSYAEVYYSAEFQHWALVLDDEEAYHYALEEILATRRRAGVEAPSPSYKEWYRKYLESPEWRTRADAAKARFGNRCALCNSDDRLEAHHRTYERVGEELVEDLVPLCVDCHGAYHRWRLGS
jgi:5-methylcytosine-specific restriction endonuclease McrA